LDEHDTETACSGGTVEDESGYDGGWGESGYEIEVVWSVVKMKGATMIDSGSIQKRRMRYCTLQFLKVTIEDQQAIILNEIEMMKNGA
jgi:hypothetical protein